MRGHNWAIVLVVGVVLSAVVVFAVVLATGRFSLRPSATADSSPLPPTLVATLSAPAPTAAAPSTAAPTDPPEEAPAPRVHVVEQGDTLTAIAGTYGVSVQALVELNQLANPDLLRLGQELLIPAKDAEPPVETPLPDLPTPVPTAAISILEGAEIAVPTPTSSGPPLIEIAQVLGSAILTEELVVIRNRGGAVSLETWTLSGDQGRRFTFPALVLYPDASVRIHTSAGTNRPGDLYWGLAEPAWKRGSLITLRDAESEVVDTYIVP